MANFIDAVMNFFKPTYSDALLEHPQVQYPLRLVDKELIGGRITRFRFALPMKRKVLGLKPGRQVYLVVTVNGSSSFHPFTPISTDEDVGYVDFLIEIPVKEELEVCANECCSHFDTFTKYLNELSLDSDAIEIKGPTGELQYNGKGEFALTGAKGQITVKQYSNVLMIGEGVAVSPLYQIIKAILKDEHDQTKIHLIMLDFENDIFLHEELKELADKHKHHLKVICEHGIRAKGMPRNQLKETCATWISIVEKDIPKPNESFVLLACSKLMTDHVCTPALDKMGYLKDERYTF